MAFDGMLCQSNANLPGIRHFKKRQKKKLMTLSFTLWTNSHLFNRQKVSGKNVQAEFLCVRIRPPRLGQLVVRGEMLTGSPSHSPWAVSSSLPARLWVEESAVLRLGAFGKGHRYCLHQGAVKLVHCKAILMSSKEAIVSIVKLWANYSKFWVKPYSVLCLLPWTGSGYACQCSCGPSLCFLFFCFGASHDSDDSRPSSSSRWHWYSRI